MKKIFFVVVFLFVFTNVIYGNETENKKLKGGYKNCKTYQYEYKFGEFDFKSKILINISKYDVKGNLIEEVSPNINGVIAIGRQTYKYDVKGNMISWIGYNIDGSIERKDTYRYDIKGNRIEWIVYNSEGGISSKSNYNYDTTGIIVEEVWWSAGRENFKTILQFDTIGNKIEEIRINVAGLIMSKNTYKYDYRKKIIEEVRTQGTMYIKHTYKYDANKNIIENKSFNIDGTIYSKDTYKYDTKGNLIEQVKYDINGEPTTKLEYVYSK